MFSLRKLFRREELKLESSLPRIGMVSTPGYVTAKPPLGGADTGGQVVYVLEQAKPGSAAEARWDAVSLSAEAWRPAPARLEYARLA